uniref:ARAD1B04686p n=1 Tax=Blastobotrys adeninivorans TaxID=409370 RepID=A0A060T540_BLAAD
MECHLVVLVHGLWGTVGHFNYIASQLAEQGAFIHNDLGSSPSPKEVQGMKGGMPTIVYRAYGNQGYFTYDGVDVCGTRVAGEIIDELDRLNKSGDWKVTKLSIAGYSLGGLVSRYAIGVLHRQEIPQKYELHLATFTTFATPHVGVVVLGSSLMTRCFNTIGTLSMSATSRQLFLKDKFHNDRPLLEYMTSPRSPFYQGLTQFDKVSLYANIAHDARCEWYTASISSSDPFAGMSHLVEGTYVQGYGPTVLDMTQPIHIAPHHDEPKSTGFFRRVLNFAKVMFRLCVVLPVWFVAFTINATYQHLASSIRMRSFRSQGRMNLDMSPVIDELLEEEANKVVESMYKVVARPSRRQERDAPGTEPLDEDDHAHEEAPLLDKKLPLNSAQQSIVSQLNQLPWNKYGVHITKHHHGHAAIIVRYPAKGFVEGETVVRHWLDNVLTE